MEPVGRNILPDRLRSPINAIGKLFCGFQRRTLFLLRMPAPIQQLVHDHQQSPGDYD